MTRVGRYLRLLGVQVRMSLLTTLQYRADFWIECGLTVFWIAATLVPLIVLFELRDTVAGWRWPEALLVVGFFTVLKSVLGGAIQPSLDAVVQHVRNGTLDFILLKPADAQFLVSTAKFSPARVADLVAGLGMLVYAMHIGDIRPSVGGVLAALLLLAGAVGILYSIWILVVSLSFLVVKVDNLTFLFSSIYDAARWPGSIFRGVAAVLLTFVVPLTVMTTYPALALRDVLTAREAATAVFVTAMFIAGGRWVWMRSIGRYTSAGG